MKKGVQTAICCPCGKEKILALGLCATCYMLKRQDAEYFGGPREQVLERDWVNSFAGSRDYKCYNQIEVDGPEIRVRRLQQILVKAIFYDRVGYGTTP